MSFWYDKMHSCSYEQWIDRAGGLMRALDMYLQINRTGTVLEFGTGNSTRVFAKRCDLVVTVDINKDSIIVPVDEQTEKYMAEASSFKKEDNVEFICSDILSMDYQALNKYSFDLILFDVGSALTDKYLYNILYDKLKDSNNIKDSTVLFIDNSDACPDFINRLRYEEKYTVSLTPTSQAIATK